MFSSHYRAWCRAVLTTRVTRAPTRATRAVVSVDEFCTAAKKFEKTFTETDTTNLAEGVEALKSAARDLKDLGTPADIPDDARDGLELTLDKLIGLARRRGRVRPRWTCWTSARDERAKSMAFEDYLDDSCPYRQGNDG